MRIVPTTIKAIAEQIRGRYPDLADAIGEAVALLVDRDGTRWKFLYHDHAGAPVYQMTGRDCITRYVTSAGACTCPAYKHRHTLCYHRVARRILTIRSANLTAVEWGEAFALEETTHHEAQPIAEQRERFVEALQTPRQLTIRESMDVLEQHLKIELRQLQAIKE